MHFSFMVFNYIYILEAIIKIIALKFSNYIQNRWNILDFFVAILGAFDLLVEYYLYKTFSTTGFMSSFMNFIKLLRLLRVVKIVRFLKQLRKLIFTIYLCIPAIMNVASLLFLVYFIFAILCVFLFHQIGFLDADG